MIKSCTLSPNAEPCGADVFLFDVLDRVSEATRRADLCLPRNNKAERPHTSFRRQAITHTREETDARCRTDASETRRCRCSKPWQTERRRRSRYG